MSTIRCPLFEAATISRHEKAVAYGQESLLYFDLDEMAARAARNLWRAGVAPGERVAIFLENSWQLVAILFGCWRAGVVACPLNVRLPRAAALEQVRELGARHLVARVAAKNDPEFAGLTILPPDELLIYRDPAEQEVEGWPLQLDAPATILFTSGSSGRPKAAVHSIANHYYNARGSNQNIRLSSRDRWLLALPLYHVGGLGILFRCALAGACVAIPDAGEAVEAAQERYGATHLSLVPAQLYALLHETTAPASFAQLKCILLGGSPVSPALLAEAMRRRWPVYTTYGLTEMASQVCTMGPMSPPPKRMTSGRVLNHRELRIAADGEIHVRGATLFIGYAEGASVRRPVDADGWFATGDLGALDAEGYLTVTGRKDNLFISGGENIQPEEVEACLAAVPAVASAIVAPRADAKFGARPVAFIRWRGEPLGPEALNEQLARVLPRYKIPVDVLPWPDDLPDGLKASRAELARRLRVDHG